MSPMTKGPPRRSLGDDATMTRDEVSAFLRRHHEALNRHDSHALATFYTEDAVVRSPMFHTVAGRAAIARAFETLFKIWPDYHLRTMSSLFICEGNRAADFTTVMATHNSELFGLPPTGEPIEYDAVRLYTFRDRLIADERRVYDLVGVLERLGKARLDRELTVAADIQRMLLPRTRHSDAHVEAVGTSMPSRAIGGDFFEYVHLPSGDFGLALGDASGKGPAAALVAAMVQGIFSVEAGASQGPSTTLSKVNQAMRRRGMEPYFVTLVYGVLSTNGRFRYSNAGQNPPILLTETGTRHLTAGGPMLGVFDEVAFPEETVSLHPGDTLVVFSDGVTDALNDRGEDFTNARLLACLEGRLHEPPQAILDALVGHIRAFCGDAAQGDDVTIVVVQFR